MMSEIKGTDGYRDELPVAVVGENYLEDLSTVEMEMGAGIKYTNYAYTQQNLLNNISWRQFMKFHCGYEPEYLDADSVNQLVSDNEAKIKEMSCYPDKGSIQVIDDIVTVKFAETE